jgi:hypothetical protein
MDIREAYFKNKVQSLMMKNSVVKILKKPPMSKKIKTSLTITQGLKIKND